MYIFFWKALVNQAIRIWAAEKSPTGSFQRRGQNKGMHTCRNKRRLDSSTSAWELVRITTFNSCLALELFCSSSFHKSLRRKMNIDISSLQPWRRMSLGAPPTSSFPIVLVLPPPHHLSLTNQWLSQGLVATVTGTPLKNLWVYKLRKGRKLEKDIGF